MALLFFLEGSKKLTLKFSDPAAGLFGGSFPFLGYGSVCSRILVWMLFMEFGRGRTCALRISASFESTRLIGASFGSTRLIRASFGSTRLMCASFGRTRLIRASFGSTRLMCASFGSTRLIRASFGSTRLMCASFGSTRLIRASFGSTRLICASFGSNRLICAFYGTSRLLCRVGAQRGADRREAGRMREGHMDASGFLIASAISPLDIAPKMLGSLSS
ncbi:NAC-alpha domain-containing protein 1 [Cucumis melo var. makuwa]|uniref:NAC-alpha domain-containing protein 1 n=1 Tax=Cucumis melo var. makuwa TaxID=1194695 RepID=A0A5A7TXW6_CUCMM|nr:NAC-alpha domain-containing protein 1 [Cucumis melo var. makuwa]